MKKLLPIILLSASLFANELEVDGGLVVTESVTASSFVGDGSGLTNLQSLGGEKPERIYQLKDSQQGTYVVPQGKFWNVHFTGEVLRLYVDGNTNQITLDTNGAVSTSAGFYFFQNQTLFVQELNQGYMIIFEYSLSGSGNDQGMDYIVP